MNEFIVPLTVGNTFVFTPKYEIHVSYSMKEKIFQWVRDNCNGGFQLSQTWDGRPLIKLVDDADYSWFILAWEGCYWQ